MIFRVVMGAQTLLSIIMLTIHLIFFNAASFLPENRLCLEYNPSELQSVFCPLEFRVPYCLDRDD